MAYRLVARPQVDRDMESFPQKVQRQILKQFKALEANPRNYRSEKLEGYDDQPHYRVYSGSYRIIYVIDDAAKLVTVTDVGHRKDVYRRF